MTVNDTGLGVTESVSGSVDEAQQLITVGYSVQPLYSHSLHRRFFPSKIGGKPAWLDPHHLPNGDLDLHCQQCHQPMTFMVQIYAARSHPLDAFHRTIYLFVCCNCTNVFVALRCQLPKINPYYAAVPADVQRDTALADECLEGKCCKECGIPTSLREPPRIQDVSSSDILDLIPKTHTRCQNAREWGCATFSFPEAEIEIDDELPLWEKDEARSQKDFSHEHELLDRYRDEEKLNPEALLDMSEEKAFEEIQNDRLIRDRDFAIFLTYMEAHPDHVIRYAPGQHPLWISSHMKPSEKDILEAVGPCINCGSPREFEFQVQPNLIYELHTDRVSFGVLCIYTCKNSCSPKCNATSRYIPEAVVVQPECFRMKHSDAVGNA